MAVFLNNKVGVKVNSVDLSDHCTAVTLNRSFDELEVTAMGDTGHKFVKGLEASSVTLSLLNDTASSKTLQTLQAAWGTNVTVVLLQDKDSAVSATNPLYTFTALVNNTTDINGGVGDLGTQDVTWNVSGAIAVATSGSF
jgi:archaellin